MAKLRIEKGEKSPSEIELGTDALGIGRGSGNELHFSNPWLSRAHARIFWQDDGHVLEDLGSSNGTYLNGRRLASKRPLRHGDAIVLGDIALRYIDALPATLKVRESTLPLTSDSTVVLTSDELDFGRYREPERVAGDDGSLLPELNLAASALISNYPLEELLELVLKLANQAIGAERAALLLRAHDGERDLKIEAAHGIAADEDVHVSRTIIDEVLWGKKAILTLDAQTDARFDGSISIKLEGIRSVICVPLLGGRGVIGMIYLDHRVSNRKFTPRDLRLVGLIANMAAVKIENLFLLEEQIEMRRMEEQLALGAKIQRALLPARSPLLEGYEVCGATRSCYEIGGDYYDFIAKRDGKLAVVIADVAGKGVGAALLMTALQASLRALVHNATSPATLIEQLNQALVDNSPANKFATLFYAEIDAERHVLEYVSGGHNPGFLLSAEGIRELLPSGPIVGLVPEVSYASRRVDLPPASTLLLYTDGVTELMVPSGEEFGCDRLRDVLAENPSRTAERLVEAVYERLTSFSDNSGFDDDMTVLVVRRTR